MYNLRFPIVLTVISFTLMLFIGAQFIYLITFDELNQICSIRSDLERFGQMIVIVTDSVVMFTMLPIITIISLSAYIITKVR